MLTQDELREALPAAFKTAATPQLLAQINAIATDPEEAKVFRENFLSFGSVLEEGRFRLDDYISAVTYVSHKMMGCSNQTAWKKTFPDRYQILVNRAATEKEISSYVAAYNSGQLVNKVREQSLIPTWVLNAHAYQEAINVQYSIMNDEDVSAKVRVEAANSLLTHLKVPETKKVQIDLGGQTGRGLDALKDMMASLAQVQIAAIEAGVATKDVAHQPIPGSMRDVTPKAPDVV
jgi:hypothetical protein